jgi:excisionase family DNA binding protein
MDTTIILSPIPIADLMAQMRVIVRDELKQQQVADLAEKLLTAKEAADLLRVSTVTLWQWYKDGRIIKHKMGSRTYFKYSELMAGLENLKRSSRSGIKATV